MAALKGKHASNPAFQFFTTKIYKLSLNSVMAEDDDPLTPHGQALRSTSEAWDGTNLAAAWHRTAKVSRDDAKCFSRCLGLLVAQQRQRMGKAGDFDAKSLACVLWAWGKLKVKEKDLLEDLCQRIPGRILHFTCRDLANMVYGLALLQHRDAATSSPSAWMRPTARAWPTSSTRSAC